MNKIPSHVKLKHYPVWKQNQQELEDDLKWFFKYCIPATVLFCLLIISGIFLVVHHADAIDAFFTSLLP